MARDGRLWDAITRSMGRLAQGYGLSVLIGVPLGIVMGRVRTVRRILRPLVVGLQALPSICWLPLALLWFGLIKGKTLAAPQLGNTQDIALRHWLGQQGMKVGQDVTVTPLSSPDILGLFSNGKLEGAWVPEPWGARMEAVPEQLQQAAEHARQLGFIPSSDLKGLVDDSLPREVLAEGAGPSPTSTQGETAPQQGK